MFRARHRLPHFHVRAVALACLMPMAAATWAAGSATAEPVPHAEQDPAVDCYRHARDGSGEAYPCDLAVQIARDRGDNDALARALANRALVFAHDGRLQSALEDINAALQAAPDRAELHGNRGNLLLRLGRPGEALAAHDRAVTLAPRDPTTYYNRAFSYRALGQPQRALEDLGTVRGLL